MPNVDHAILTANPEYTTSLALALEGAMLLDDAARAAYARIYGREWESLVDAQTAARAARSQVGTVAL